jgi:hypothetical protein
MTRPLSVIDAEIQRLRASAHAFMRAPSDKDFHLVTHVAETLGGAAFLRDDVLYVYGRETRDALRALQRERETAAADTLARVVIDSTPTLRPAA